MTARDIKGSVEGYQEMSDEAFARRFYSDRAELLALGVPLHSQRDEYTGEELYNMRSESYFLPPLELDRRRAGGAADLPLPARGEVRVRRAAAARAPEPRARASRLRRGADRDRHARRGARSRVLAPRCRGGSGSSRARSRSSARSSSPTGRSRATRSASARSTRTRSSRTPAPGTWSAQDLDAADERTFRVSRIRGEIRFATRRERDFRLPADFDVDRYRGRPPWQIGEPVGEARIEVGGDTAWWVERTFGDSGRIEDGVFVTEYSSLPLARVLGAPPGRSRGAARAG